jgi:hypothetical protein
VAAQSVGHRGISDGVGEMKDRGMKKLRKYLESISIRCPECNGSRITSDNSTPLNHTCLDCGHKFKGK